MGSGGFDYKQKRKEASEIKGVRKGKNMKREGVDEGGICFKV